MAIVNGPSAAKIPTIKIRERLFFDKRDIAEKISCSNDRAYPEEGPETAVKFKFNGVHLSGPATNGAKERTIGTKRARTIVLPPCFS